MVKIDDGGGGAPPSANVHVVKVDEFIEAKGISSHLAEPKAGESQLDHTDGWKEMEGIWKTVRDKVNELIDTINDLADKGGFGRPLEGFKLPSGTLYDILIEPLAGDYGKIGSNGNACENVNKAMKPWGRNMFYISAAGIGTKWDGSSAVAFGMHMTAYGLVAQALGFVVDKGKYIFDGLALTSEWIGVECERMILALGKLLEKLAKTIIKRLGGGWFSWAGIAYDVIKDGLEVITEPINDIKLAVELAGLIDDFIDKSKKWAGSQEARLEAFKELPELVQSLPKTTGGAIEAGQVTPGMIEDLKKLLDAFNAFEVTPEDVELFELLQEIKEIAGEGIKAGDK